jgi:hypothetical protein
MTPGSYALSASWVSMATPVPETTSKVTRHDLRPTRRESIFVCVIMKCDFTDECKWNERIDTATTGLPSQKPPPFPPQSATTWRHSFPGVDFACRSGTVRRHNVKPVGVALERERAVSVLQDVLVLECCSRRQLDSRGPQRVTVGILTRAQEDGVCCVPATELGDAA